MYSEFFFVILHYVTFRGFCVFYLGFRVRVAPCDSPPLCPVCTGRPSEDDVLDNCPEIQCNSTWVSRVRRYFVVVGVVCRVVFETWDQNEISNRPLKTSAFF